MKTKPRLLPCSALLLLATPWAVAHAALACSHDLAAALNSLPHPTPAHHAAAPHQMPAALHALPAHSPSASRA